MDLKPLRKNMESANIQTYQILNYNQNEFN